MPAFLAPIAGAVLSALSYEVTWRRTESRKFDKRIRAEADIATREIERLYDTADRAIREAFKQRFVNGPR